MVLETLLKCSLFCNSSVSGKVVTSSEEPSLLAHMHTKIHALVMCTIHYSLFILNTLLLTLCLAYC